MSTNSDLRARFGQPAPTPTASPARSTSEPCAAQELVRTGPIDQPISVSRRLREAGLSMRAAYNALNALVETSRAICDLPVDVDLDSLAADLAALNVALRRRRPHPEPAAFLAEVRSRHGLSQRQFADRLGFDVRTLQNWEQGRNRPDPAILNLVRIFDRDPRIVADAIFEPL